MATTSSPCRWRTSTLPRVGTATPSGCGKSKGGTAPQPAVTLERDGVRIGFAVNGGDPASEGAAIRVTDIHRARDELQARGVATGDWRVDEEDGRRLQVFFVIAPDGLCYYFHQPLDEA